MGVAKKQHARSLFRTERAVCLIINVTFYKICRWIWLFINEMLKKATDTLVSRVFNGSFGSLAAFLVNSDKLTNKDLDKIKQLIDDKEKEV